MSMPDDIESALNALAPNLMPSGQKISGLKRLSGGASQETWAFDVTSLQGETGKRILRRAPGGVSDARSESAISLKNEADLIRMAANANVPVPYVRHVCMEEDGLGEAFIMDFLSGETIARRILRNDDFSKARVELATDCGAALARIHAIDSASLTALKLSGGVDQLSRYEEIYRSFDIPRPVFELAFQMLRETQPPALAPVLVHGDFRLGNLMVAPEGLTGVLDWELAHIGDPREDIGWLCVNSWRFGHAELRAGGFAHLEAVLEAYADAGGQRFSIEDIDWWEMLGSLKWGIMCLIMYEAYRSGADPSVERAAIGRRVSETEIDLIALMETRVRHA